MWDNNIMQVAKERQAEFRRQAQRERMIRSVESGKWATGRAGGFFRRMLSHAEEWMAVPWKSAATAGRSEDCEQLAC